MDRMAGCAGEDAAPQNADGDAWNAVDMARAARTRVAATSAERASAIDIILTVNWPGHHGKCVGASFGAARKPFKIESRVELSSGKPKRSITAFTKLTHLGWICTNL